LRKEHPIEQASEHSSDLLTSSTDNHPDYRRWRRWDKKGEERTSLEQASEHSSDLLASCTDIILIVVADAVEERHPIEQAREHSSELLASSIILIVLADAGEERTFLEQAREHGGEPPATMYRYHADYRC